MKKLFSMLAVFAMVVVSAFAFSACGNKGLTASDVVGEWYTESANYKDGDAEAVTYTFAQFDAAHTASSAEYNQLKSFFKSFKVTEDGKIQAKDYFAEDNTYADYGTWEIKDGKLNSTAAHPTEGETYETKYEDGKIVITVVNDTYHYRTVLTLAKKVAA